MIGATLFSGGRLAEALLTDIIDFRYAVEFDPAIAAVGAQLGGQTIVSDVRLVDYSTWGLLDYLHASPVCKNASQAKTDGEESATDIETAQAVVRCLEATQPSVFTLENVWGYRTFEAFRRICQALDRGGYMWHFEHLNAADFAVPQTRRRLILRASRGLLPTLPPAVPWVGWYAAVKDLLPTLPDSRLARWQFEKLPRDLKQTVLIESKNANQQYGDYMRQANEPAPTVVTDHKPSHAPKAFIVCNQHADPVSPPDRRIRTAFEHEPALPVTATKYGDYRGWLTNGRTVQMTPRALARFQSVPDWYELPSRASLACTVIGNGIPSLMMRKIVEQLV